MPEDFEADEMMDEGPAKPVAKKGKSKLLIIGVPVVLIQLVAAYFIVMYFFKGDMPETKKEAVVEEVKKEKEEFGAPYLLEDLTINIPSEGRRSRYFVTDIGFECESEAVAAEMGEREMQIKDIIIGTIMTKKVEQLLSSKFVNDTLKLELRNKVNDVLMEGIVKSVYLSERIIQ